MKDHHTIRPRLSHPPSGNYDLPFVLPVEARNETEKGRLPAPARPEQTDNLLFEDFGVHPLQSCDG